MKKTNCIFSSSTALTKVFLPNAGPSRRVDFAAAATGAVYCTVVPQFLAPAPLASTQPTQQTQRRYAHFRAPPPRPPPPVQRSGSLLTRRGPRPPPVRGANSSQGNNHGFGRQQKNTGGYGRANNNGYGRQNVGHGRHDHGHGRQENGYGRQQENGNERQQDHDHNMQNNGHQRNNNNKASTRGPIPPASRISDMPQDEEIEHEFVHVKLADGSLSEPQRTFEVLMKLDRATHALVMLAMPTPKKGGLQWPICRVVDVAEEKKAQFDKQKATRAKSQDKRKANRSKELELNWAIDSHDLGHRLNKLQEFLEGGRAVEVRLFHKGRGRDRKRATREEAAEVLRRVRETVSAVPGAKDSKKAEGELLGTMILRFEV